MMADSRTNRGKEVAELANKGLTQAQIAESLGIRYGTVARLAWMFNITISGRQTRRRRNTNPTRAHDVPRVLDYSSLPSERRVPPSAAMLALAQFDPVIARAAAQRMRESAVTPTPSSLPERQETLGGQVAGTPAPVGFAIGAIAAGAASLA